MSRFLRITILLAGSLALIWLLGLEIFVTRVDMYARDVPSNPTEAIVVLTGGSERVEMGLDLLTTGMGKKLLISGVPVGTTLNELIGKRDVPANLRNCCITLGHKAETTHGNARETAEWMKAEGLNSLTLVTAHYHMPRSLVLFHDAMPDVAITPHAVTPDGVKLNGWWLHAGTSNLLITEYMKYLSVLVRGIFNPSV